MKFKIMMSNYYSYIDLANVNISSNCNLSKLIYQQSNDGDIDMTENLPPSCYLTIPTKSSEAPADDTLQNTFNNNYINPSKNGRFIVDEEYKLSLDEII